MSFGDTHTHDTCVRNESISRDELWDAHTHTHHMRNEHLNGKKKNSLTQS